MNKIAEYRKTAGLTQSEAAAAAGWSHQTRWSSYETGARIPGVDEIRKILDVLNSHGASCTFDDVFPGAQKTNTAA